MAEMEEMTASCRRQVQRHQDQVEKERQAARERVCQIQQLEAKFTAI